MNKTAINHFQTVIEEICGDYVFRFTDTISDNIHTVKLNEIACVKNGGSNFIWSDDTSISLYKKFSNEFLDENLKEFMDELKVAFHLKF